MGFFDSDVTYGDAYNLPTDYKSGLKDILGEAKKLYESTSTEKKSRKRNHKEDIIRNQIQRQYD